VFIWTLTERIRTVAVKDDRDVLCDKTTVEERNLNVKQKSSFRKKEGDQVSYLRRALSRKARSLGRGASTC
jgi:hypothetical protein